MPEFSFSQTLSRLSRCLLLGLVLLGTVSTVQAWPFLHPFAKQDSYSKQSPQKLLKPGRLLVAMPQQKDPRFKQAVVLLLQYNRNGAVGVIINRPTRLTLGTEFEGRVADAKADQKLFWGGPVSMDQRVMLFEEPTDETDESSPGVLLQQLRVALSGGQFQQLLEQALPQRFRIYAGYTGWAPRQLELEIIHGQWLILPGDPELLFQADTQTIWNQLMSYHNGRLAVIDAVPEDWSFGGDAENLPANRALTPARSG
ncbi:YqgE/AlgH family protein [Motiliproteus coralliicola]|uniref:YqgE/AlgH family protein n=1 Tax=Motiliproteus coralliicola TaxID=2283196 RepID=A0A369WM29_9GAMM|nr:YqgE/AlgH family protein [Motiliproteus coralliicola]RDE22727.1 YqgE/AlgH family protein [Motiliproteus coralliicola]